MGNAFAAASEKYGATPLPKSSPPSVTPEQMEDGYSKLFKLLNTYYQVVRPVIVRPTRWTDEGVGLDILNHEWWCDNADLAQDIHDLFWSEVGAVFVKRHRHELMKVTSELEWLPEDMWHHLTS